MKDFVDKLSNYLKNLTKEELEKDFKEISDKVKDSNSTTCGEYIYLIKNKICKL